MQKVDVSDTKIVTLTLAEIRFILELIDAELLYDAHLVRSNNDPLDTAYKKLKKALN